MYLHILGVVLYDSDRDFCKYLFYASLYYGGELAYYMFYTVVIVTFTHTIYFTRRNYYSGGLTFSHIEVCLDWQKFVYRYTDMTSV